MNSPEELLWKGATQAPAWHSELGAINLIPVGEQMNNPDRGSFGSNWSSIAHALSRHSAFHQGAAITEIDARSRKRHESFGHQASARAP
jgi:hypothetical protein